MTFDPNSFDDAIRRHPTCTISTSQANWVALHGAHVIDMNVARSPFFKAAGEFIHERLDDELSNQSTPRFFEDIDRPMDVIVTVTLDLALLITVFSSLTNVHNAVQGKLKRNEIVLELDGAEMIHQAYLSFSEHLRHIDPEIMEIFSKMFAA